MSGGDADLVALARSLVGSATGGEQIEVAVGRSTSTSVKVFGGEVESFTSASTDGAGVRVIRDGRQGFAHCGSLEPDVLAETLAEARDNCRFAEPDEFNGLAEPDGVAPVAQDGWSDAVVALATLFTWAGCSGHDPSSRPAPPPEDVTMAAIDAV